MMQYVWPTVSRLFSVWAQMHYPALSCLGRYMNNAVQIHILQTWYTLQEALELGHGFYITVEINHKVVWTDMLWRVRTRIWKEPHLWSWLTCGFTSRSCSNTLLYSLSQFSLALTAGSTGVLGSSGTGGLKKNNNNEIFIKKNQYI